MDQILEKYKDRLLCLPIRDVICSCSVPRGLFLVKFLLTAFREFHLGIPTRDRVCGWGMALPLLSQESLVRRHKSSAAWPMGGTWAGRGSLYLHLRTWQERPSGARAGQVKCKELSKGEKAEGIHPSISQKPSAFLETGMPGILAHWTQLPWHFLFSLFPLRTSDSLSVTCECLRGEMVPGLGAMGGIQASAGTGGQR